MAPAIGVETGLHCDYKHTWWAIHALCVCVCNSGHAPGSCDSVPRAHTCVDTSQMMQVARHDWSTGPDVSMSVITCKSRVSACCVHCILEGEEHGCAQVKGGLANGLH
jgi:hypothetical protein